jgi:hypothetical protein
MSVFEFRDRIETAIDDKMAAIASNVVNGRAESQEEYRRLTGIIKGLDEAKGIILAEYKRMFESQRVSNVEGSHDETTD